MSPVSSSTFTCASASWRNIAGRRATSGSSPGGGSSVGGHDASPPSAAAASSSSPSSPGIGSTSTRPGPRLHLAREQREVLAQRVALELRTGGRGGAARDGRRTRCRTSPRSRARASRRPGYTDTHDSTRRSSSSTSVFRIDAPAACAASTRRTANTWKRPSQPATPYVVSFGCAGVDVSPEPSSATAGVGIQSMPAMNER